MILKGGALVASSSFVELFSPFFFVVLIFHPLYILPGMKSEIFFSMLDNIFHRKGTCQKTSRTDFVEHPRNFYFNHFSLPNNFYFVAVCAFPYVLAFTTDSIEIRLVVNGNLVHTAVVPELQLVASRVRQKNHV